MYQIKLSPYAKTFYNEWLLDPNSSRYNMCSADQTLFGTLDVEKLRLALKRYINDHVLLNSHIQDINGEPYWVKNEKIYELEYLNNSVNQAELLDFVSRSFDLYRGPLYRFRLIRISNSAYRFIVILHHLVMDGISLNIGIFELISHYYNNKKYKIKYSIQDQINLLINLEKNLSTTLDKNKNKHKKFWYKQLHEIENINLKFLKSEKNLANTSSLEIENTIKEINFNFNKTEAEKLEKIKHKYMITPYFYSQCIFALLLNKYTGQQNFAIAYPISIKEGIDFIYGGQINLNLIPYHFNKNTTIKDLFDRIKNFFRLTIKNNIKYGYYPITSIIQENNNKELLDVYFSQSYFRTKLFKFKEIKKIKNSTEYAIDGITSDTLLFEHEPTKEQLNYRVRYNKNYIDERLLNIFINCYKKLFREILEDLIHGNDNIFISSYSLLNKKQYEQIIYKYNQTNKQFSQNKTIHQLFEAQALRTPDNIAMTYKNINLSYKELNMRANQLANHIRHYYSIQPDDLIALCLDKDENIIIAILATLKSGAAYIPLAPEYPIERIKYILEDAKVKLILTNEKNQVNLRLKENIIAIDSKSTLQALSIEKTYNPKVKMPSSSLSYIIYTSGTTGKPKGVLQQHNNVVRLFNATKAWFQFTNQDIWTLFHSYTFDFTIWEIWGALLHGGKLIIPTLDQIKDAYLFYDLCYKEKVTILNQTPTAFYLFKEVAIKNIRKQRLHHLRYIIFGGEALNFESLHDWCSLYGYDNPKLINLYGPTETTVFVTYKEIKKEDNTRISHIGVRVPDQKLYILDNYKAPLPLGAIGELHIGGMGLARGYLNQPNLTQEKFIFNPFQSKKEKLNNKNCKLYKTGDLVRMLFNGNLEYIGRNDFQVKIRGHRIELNEIENKLINYVGIKQAVVVAEKFKSSIGNYTNSSYLIAYYVSSIKINESKLKDYITKTLPDYMRPSIIINLNKIPLTTSGKIDLNLLPKPELKSHEKYEPPKNFQEKLICEAFSNVLHLRKAGINDDFFKLGGNSIQAIQLTFILQNNFDVKVADIFKLRTPKKLAKHSTFGKNLLMEKLKHLKLSNQNKKVKYVSNSILDKKIEIYMNDIKKIKIDSNLKKPIRNILLTGSTGFLGCNILNQLLKSTNYNIYLLIRADTKKEAFNRINKKFKFYFNKLLNDVYNTRIFIIKSDIEKYQLGLPEKSYQNLSKKIDSIIHAAALVKHYGNYDQFYSANVQATINLLELAKLTSLKDFHYISTYSVFLFDSDSKDSNYIYTETDSPYNLVKWYEFYDQTKFQGEQCVIQYRLNQIKTNIYRVGNLAFISENYKSQENIETNAFAHWLKCLLKIKCTTESISNIQLSQADFTAQAIVKLFDKKQLIDDIYHVFNPYSINIAKIFSDKDNYFLKNLTMEQFINTIIQHLNNGIPHDLIIKFLLHQGWLDDRYLNNRPIQILQVKTQFILKQLDFEWLPITNSMFNNYIKGIK